MSDPAGTTFRRSTHLATTALVIYVCGGVLTFGGLFLSVRRWFAVGPSGLAGGILLVVAGVFCSMVGVFLMRIVRNRHRR